MENHQEPHQQSSSVCQQLTSTNLWNTMAGEDGKPGTLEVNRARSSRAADQETTVELDWSHSETQQQQHHQTGSTLDSTGMSTAWKTQEHVEKITGEGNEEGRSQLDRHG